MPEQDPVQFIVEEGVGIVTIQRPRKGNAINEAVMDRLADIASEIPERAATVRPRALVITGSGQSCFSAGADISGLVDLSEQSAYEQMRQGQDVFDLIEALPCPVIAAINGVALGGGLELAMACDLRVAVGSARFGQAEITLENLPGWGGTQRLPRLIGLTRAMEMILTGRQIDADTALEWGLINAVVDDARAHALELASRLAASSPTAIVGAKRAIRTGWEHGRHAGHEAEARAVAACCVTPEQQKAVRDFLGGSS